MLRQTLALAALATAGLAHAQEYFPPDGTGWWQLQTVDTYEQVCAQEAGPCTPAPGTYRLIDFGTSPATRTLVTIDGAAEPPAPSDALEFFAGERVTRVITSEGGLDIGAVVTSCGVGANAIGGMCSATVDGVPVPLVNQGVVPDDQEYFCTAEVGAQVSAQPTCVGRRDD